MLPLQNLEEPKYNYRKTPFCIRVWRRFKTTEKIFRSFLIQFHLTPRILATILLLFLVLISLVLFFKMQIGGHQSPNEVEERKSGEKNKFEHAVGEKEEKDTKKNGEEKKEESKPKEEAIKETDKKKSKIEISPGSDLLQLIRKHAPIEEDNLRREAIKQAFQHGWNGYKKFGFGSDVINPLSSKSENSICGFGATIFSSLDTAILMNMEEVVKSGNEFVEKMTFEKDVDCSLFDLINIYLGGLLGAHTLRPNPIYKKKLEELGSIIADSMTNSIIPRNLINLKTRESKHAEFSFGSAILSEVGGIQLELCSLSHFTNNQTHCEKARNITKQILMMEPKDGLFPVYVSTEERSFVSDYVTIGTFGDHFYEYLFKQISFNISLDEELKEYFQDFLSGVKSNLLRTSNPRKFTFVGELRHVLNPGMNQKMDENVCFLPSLLLQHSTLVNNEKVSSEIKSLATRILDTCIYLFDNQTTKLIPKSVCFNIQQDISADAHDYYIISPKFQLHSSIFESLFVFHRITKNNYYRETAWKLFEHIVRSCWVENGFSGLEDVERGSFNDKLDPLFFSTTLKYLFLIFAEESILPLENFAFTTSSAHPLRRISSIKKKI